MPIVRFEDIIAWQKAMQLAVAIYKEFNHSNDFGFRDQICRAAVSITNNIAEGYERQSNKEFRQFLFIAKGSCGEVRSMLHLAHSLQYTPTNRYKTLYADANEVSRIIAGFIKTL